MLRSIVFLIVVLTVWGVGLLAFAAEPAGSAPVPEIATVRQTWKILDYLAVDYAGAVGADGNVLSPSEFAEMREFAATAHKNLAGLSAKEAQADLLKQTDLLEASISARRPPEEIAKLCHALAAALLAAYPIPVAPSKAPDLVRGAQLFSEKCAVCHGLQGHGDGPAAAKLNPPPIAFSNHERARERSPHSYFEVISQGVADTPMVSFQSAFSDDDRWALAFHVANFAFTDEQRAAGEKLWKSDQSLHARVTNLEALSTTSEAALTADIGEDKAAAVIAYLRRHPDALQPSGVAVVRAKLTESMSAYTAGDTEAASQRALSAYLDGFEPLEAALQARDSGLLGRVETAMAELRTRIDRHADAAAVQQQIQVVNGLLDDVERVMGGDNDAVTAFLGAFTILLREGIEAMLVVVAMLSFLAKVERRDVLPYVHAGWIGALLAGAATWAVAAFLIDIKGAHREMTEGVSSLFAAFVLLGVGIWMHQKSVAGRWQVYIREKLSAALTRRSAFVMFLLAFVAVYREVFEAILFYIALWTRGNGGSILAGLGAGAVALMVIALVLMRTSKRLPIGQFFAWSSALIALLAIVLAGKGVAALQEAGVLPVFAVHGPRIDVLGVYPSLLSLAAQAAVIVVAAAGFWWNTRTPSNERMSQTTR